MAANPKAGYKPSSNSYSQEAEIEMRKLGGGEKRATEGLQCRDILEMSWWVSWIFKTTMRGKSKLES